MSSTHKSLLLTARSTADGGRPSPTPEVTKTAREERLAKRRQKYRAGRSVELARQRASKERVRLRAGAWDSISCPVCGERGFRLLAKHLLDRHDLTLTQFRARFPGHPTSSATMRAIRRDFMEDRDLAPYWTRERIIAAIRYYASRSGGQPPTYLKWSRGPRKLRDPDGPFSPRGTKRPAAATVVAVFGSWVDALRAAGLEPRRGFSYEDAATCRKGHSLADMYIDPKGNRYCRRCRDQAWARQAKKLGQRTGAKGARRALSSCPICWRAGFRRIATHARAAHGLSAIEFFRLHPEHPHAMCRAGHWLLGGVVTKPGTAICDICNPSFANFPRVEG